MTVGRMAGEELNKFLGRGTKFGEMGMTSRDLNSQEDTATTEANAYIDATQIGADASVAAAEERAKGQAALGVAQSQSQGMSGMMSGIAGGIGGLGSLFGGGGGGGAATTLTTGGVSPSGIKYFG